MIGYPNESCMYVVIAVLYSVTLYNITGLTLQTRRGRDKYRLSISRCILAYRVPN